MGLYKGFGLYHLNLGIRYGCLMTYKPIISGSISREWIIFILNCGIIKYKSTLTLTATLAFSCSNIVQPKPLVSNAWGSFENSPFPWAISTVLLTSSLDVQLFYDAFLKYFRSANLLFYSIFQPADEKASYRFFYSSNFIFILIGISLQF